MSVKTGQDKPKIRLIGLGHPRSGTAYFAKRAGDFGMKVGHERTGERGISSWLWVTKDEKVPWGVGFSAPDKGRMDFPVYILRDPISLIQSVYYTEGASLEYRAAMLGMRGSELDGPTGAAVSCLRWIELARKNWGPWLQFVRLDEVDRFFEILTGSKVEKAGNRVNSRKHPKLGDRVNEIDPAILGELENIYASFIGRARETALQWHYAINPDHNSFVNESVLTRLFAKAGITKGGPILDAGCGRGVAGRILKEMGFGPVVGFDYSLERVNIAAATGGYKSVMHMDIQDIAKISASYPVVLCCEVLEHLENPESVVCAVTKTSDIVGSVPINHNYRAHLQVFKDDADVERRLGVRVLFNDGNRAWFYAQRIDQPKV